MTWKKSMEIIEYRVGGEKWEGRAKSKKNIFSGFGFLRRLMIDFLTILH